MKETHPSRRSSPPVHLWEQRSIEAWENLRCLGKQFTRTEQIEVIDQRLEELHRRTIDVFPGHDA